MPARTPRSRPSRRECCILDLALADYGPESDTPVRAGLRERLGKTIDEVWGTRESDANFAANNFETAILILRGPEKAARPPPSPRRTSRGRRSPQQRPPSIRTASRGCRCPLPCLSPLSYPLLLTVVGWLIFLVLRLRSDFARAAMPVVALAVGAIAIASAVLMILELLQPLSSSVSRIAYPA